MRRINLQVSSNCFENRIEKRAMSACDESDVNGWVTLVDVASLVVVTSNPIAWCR